MARQICIRICQGVNRICHHATARRGLPLRPGPARASKHAQARRGPARRGPRTNRFSTSPSPARASCAGKPRARISRQRLGPDMRPVRPALAQRVLARWHCRPQKANVHPRCVRKIQENVFRTEGITPLHPGALPGLPSKTCAPMRAGSDKKRSLTS